MAVLNAYSGLRTEITVNRKPLTEYDNDDVEASSAEVNKYVEARTGAEDNGVEITCSVDSHQAACWGIDPNEPTWYAPKKMKGMTLSQAGQRVHQNFQFAELNVVEDDDGAMNVQDLRKELECKGVIEVSYRWITNFRVRKQSSTTQAPPAQNGDDGRDRPLPRRDLLIAGAVPEKVLKGSTLSHQASLGRPKALKPSKGPSKTYSYVDREPFGIIRFHYRSLATLKTLQIDVEDEDELERDILPRANLRESGVRRMTASPLLRGMETKAGGVKRETRSQHVKREEGAQGVVKRERDAGAEAYSDSEDVIILETRSCKRPYTKCEVIVLE